MHRLPVQRFPALAPPERELLELCAEDWTPPLIADLLDVSAAELRLRVRGLCKRLGLAHPDDGALPVDGARLWLVEEAQVLNEAPEAA